MWVLMYVFSYSLSPAATNDRAEWRLLPTVVFQEFSNEERCNAAKSKLEGSLQEAGAKLRSGLEDLKARAAFVEALDAPFQLGPGHAPAPFICVPRAVFLVSTAQLDALGLGPCEPRIDALDNHGALELGEDATHLEHGPARRGGGIDSLLVQIQVAIERLQFIQEAD